MHRAIYFLNVWRASYTFRAPRTLCRAPETGLRSQRERLSCARASGPRHLFISLVNHRTSPSGINGSLDVSIIRELYRLRSVHWRPTTVHSRDPQDRCPFHSAPRVFVLSGRNYGRDAGNVGFESNDIHPACNYRAVYTKREVIS